MEDRSREFGFDTNIDSNESHADMDMDIGGSAMGKRVVSNTQGRLNSETDGSYFNA